jgi:hypothetical protein
MPVLSYYRSSVDDFLEDDANRIIGELALENHFDLQESQRDAWFSQILILKSALNGLSTGFLFFELYIPRMGKRVDAVLLLEGLVFVLEFKVGAEEHQSAAIDQVEDYALDLKNFHEGSHLARIVPILISTKGKSEQHAPVVFAADLVASPLLTNASDLGGLIRHVCSTQTTATLDADHWIATGYKPTPTIIEAAEVLYRTHSVEDIARSDAGAKNLRETTDCVSAVIDDARLRTRKTICFVTGVPGSGKTLAGLGMATRRSSEHADEHAVFLSGNGPLVNVLREALARDKTKREGVKKSVAERQVSSFIQNIHHFRDQYIRDKSVPSEKVVVFDEAQRAWSRDKATDFMRRERSMPDFDMSEPEFLISVMDRHLDWCTVVCLIGGGQEINTGEAGISEWITALQTRFPNWDVHVSPRISLPDYSGSSEVETFLASPRVQLQQHLHLAVSMRSFRAETLSTFVGHIVDNEQFAAGEAFRSIEANYPVFLTRELNVARCWLRTKARGTERFGLIASSGALRLRPEGIHIKAKIDPPNWFLNADNDVRSSCYMEEVASEFDVQGLELDWAGVCWDADFRYIDGHWMHYAFSGTKWQSVKAESRQIYLKNAYRVILTRARQGMVIFIPKGDAADRTRPSEYYDETFDYLRSCGLPVLS